MIYEISSAGDIKGNQIKAISSKSYAQRALICAAFADGISQIHVNDLSKDVISCIDCLCEMGALIENDMGTLTVTPVKKYIPGVFHCGDSGAVSRFLIPFAFAMGGGEFVLGESLKNRPFDDLFSSLEKNGASIKKEDGTISISGKPVSNDFYIKGDISSQYVSGLLMLLPCIGGGSVTIEGETVSLSYIQITMEVMKSFGVDVKRKNNVFSVDFGSSYRSQNYEVPGDWSNTFGFLLMGCNVSGLDVNSLQSECRLAYDMEKQGLSLLYDDEVVSFDMSGMSGFDIDICDCPDAFVYLCTYASVSKGKFVIRNIKRLKYKESDRVKEMTKLLAAFGVSFELSDDENILTIHGQKELKACEVFDIYDHRVAMAFAFMSMYADGVCRMADGECVKKSYPSFWSDFMKFGGEKICITHTDKI